MVAPLFVTLREGLEATLILGIILAYLARTGNHRHSGPVWVGTGLAVLVSLLAGAAIFFTVGELDGIAEQIFEGSTMLVAVAMLAYMVVWMRRQASGIRAELQEKLQAALSSGSGAALMLMAFVVVAREGIETALFFFAASRTTTPAESAVGGLLGLVLAAGLGYSVYRGSHRLNLRAFFNVTGVMLMIFAAGLLAHGIHEFQEAGLLPEVVEHVWNVNWLLDEKSTLGRFLTALVGYNGNPSLLEVLAYLAFLATSFTYYFRSPARPQGTAETRPRQAI
ncbi:MAG: FTR1 family protein [Chloroflexi bacterium]|nr:FTR1 family protein [Chloroflexota bacterium]